MKFVKKNYKAIIGIGLLVLLVAGICIAQVLIENKNNLEVENEENEVVEEQQTNERDETVKQLEIIADYINIRSSSNVNSKIIGKVYKGEIYTILEELGTSYDWYLIETNTGIKGYIAGKSGEDVYVNILSVTEETEEEQEEETNTITNNNKTNNNTTQNNTSQNNTQNTTTNDTTTEETEQNEFIKIKSLVMENNGGTFKVGDTITWHVVIESVYPLRYISLVVYSSVNNSSKVGTSSEFISNNNNEYSATIEMTIDENFIPGKWTFYSMTVWDKYSAMLNKNNYNSNYNYTFTVVE